MISDAAIALEKPVDGNREGNADLKAGRTQPVDQAFEELREKPGLPR